VNTRQKDSLIYTKISSKTTLACSTKNKKHIVDYCQKGFAFLPWLLKIHHFALGFFIIFCSVFLIFLQFISFYRHKVMWEREMVRRGANFSHSFSAWFYWFFVLFHQEWRYARKGKKLNLWKAITPMLLYWLPPYTN